MTNTTDIISTLSNNICLVTYNKVSGEEATMRCTLREAAAPENNGANGVITVMNVDKGQWRAFRADKLRSIEIVA